MKILYALLFFVETLVLANMDVAEIKLTGSKDQVLSPEQRSIVLEAADKYLNRSNETFITSINLRRCFNS